MVTQKDLRGVVNIDSYLAKAGLLDRKGKPVLKDRINRIGVELEGGWEKVPDGVLLTHDGSVMVPAPLRPNVQGQVMLPRVDARGRVIGQQAMVANVPATFKTGELPSDPMTREKVPKWMQAMYPSHVNHTCGLHVHMSFYSAKHYKQLMVEGYPKTIVAYMKQWAQKEELADNHPIWERLKGANRYCQHKFYADMQAQARNKNHGQNEPGHRYTVINYCWSLEDRNTLECRLLPMMDTAVQGISAVQRVLDITNAFLLMSGVRDPDIEAILEEDEGLKIEEEIVHDRVGIMSERVY